MTAIRAHSIQQPDVVIARLDNELEGLKQGHGVMSIIGVDPALEPSNYYHRFCRSRVVIDEFHKKGRFQIPRSLVHRFVDDGDNLILNSWDLLCGAAEKSFKTSAIPESPGCIINKRFNIINLRLDIDRQNVNLTFDPEMTKIIPVYDSVKIMEEGTQCVFHICPCGCGMQYRSSPDRIQYVPSMDGSVRATPLQLWDAYRENLIRVNEEIRMAREEALNRMRQSFYITSDTISGR